MQNQRRTTIGCLLAGLLAIAGVPAQAQTPLGSSFTYQGQLNQNGNPLNTTADFEFTLWDADAGGNMLGTAIAADNVAIVDGLFTIELDFGVMAFNGDARWLEISVASPTAGPLETLTPRQPLTAAPVALALRGLRTLASGDPERRESWHVLGGHPENNIGAGIAGAVVAGGGEAGFPNAVTGRAGTVSGGRSNTASGSFGATVSGGADNLASENSATVGGGFGNTASGRASVVGGGGQTRPSNGGNVASGEASTIPGGTQNVAAGDLSFAAGYRAQANHEGAFVWADSTDANFASTASDQFLIRANGNVGINKNDPATALDVNGTVTANAFIGDGSGLTNLPTQQGPWNVNGSDISYEAGNVGIGTPTPTYPLQISHDGIAVDSYPGAQVGEQAQVQMFINTTGVTGGGIAISDNGGFFDLNDGYITYLPLSTGSGMRVHGSFKVVNNAWPDYVFEDGYDLASLSEVEAHIAAHGHLPNVPSAAEVHADGVDVGEMNAVLLRKVEELTLHMIEMEKEVSRLRTRVNGN